MGSSCEPRWTCGQCKLTQLWHNRPFCPGCGTLQPRLAPSEVGHRLEEFVADAQPVTGDSAELAAVKAELAQCEWDAKHLCKRQGLENEQLQEVVANAKEVVDELASKTKAPKSNAQ